MSLTSKKEEGFVKVHLLGNCVWEQTAMIRCIEKDIKFLKPVDVSNNEEVVWSVHNGRIYIVVIFSMTAAEMRIPDNEDEDPTIELSDLSRRYIKETNEMCRQIQRKCKEEVCRLIVVPDGRLTPYPLALVGEQWNEDGLSEYILYVYIWCIMCALIMCMHTPQTLVRCSASRM